MTKQPPELPALSPEAIACGAEWAAYLRARIPHHRSATAKNGLAAAASVIAQASGSEGSNDD